MRETTGVNQSIKEKRLLSSKTFQFLVGPNVQDRTPFTIHTAIVETLSTPLAALMNGSMREAIGGVTTLEEVDEQTFVRFCEYAYIGDYTPAQQQVVLPSFQFENGDSLIKCYYKERAFLASRKSKKKKGSFKLPDIDNAKESYERYSHKTPTQKL
ncbi:uncharacterized protein RAG0_07806 [Rhynchosporium agropyri]|uniref:BTB domain-containing protein n=1 Tax=Rhynchosporium agropyri TaxID=914238 RepID=A0A1E1KRB9_9HELO|nr:uncharacterized protein RAG0_07806 [Rhynchosporium agropyri]